VQLLGEERRVPRNQNRLCEQISAELHLVSDTGAGLSLSDLYDLCGLFPARSFISAYDHVLLNESHMIFLQARLKEFIATQMWTPQYTPLIYTPKD
jgi:hypothetical protein